MLDYRNDLHVFDPRWPRDIYHHKNVYFDDSFHLPSNLLMLPAKYKQIFSLKKSLDEA